MGVEVGDVVYVTQFDEETRTTCVFPAIVTRVLEGGRVSLQVFQTKRITPRLDVPYSEAPRSGHWSWPPEDSDA